VSALAVSQQAGFSLQQGCDFLQQGFSSDDILAVMLTAIANSDSVISFFILFCLFSFYCFRFRAVRAFHYFPTKVIK
jgi:hypothetical protein